MIPGFVLYICSRKYEANQLGLVPLTTLPFSLRRRPPAGFAKSPARITWALGSTDLIAVEETLTSLPYSVGFGFATKYLKFGSFQTCQALIGFCGRVGCSDQKLPPVP